MKYSARWLGRYVDLGGVDPEHFVKRVTLSVAEVEGWHPYGAGLETCRIARVVSVARHPDAAKLTVCEVDDGGRRTVACGAPNVRAGMVTVLAPPGARVGGKEIQEAALRGVVSQGMLCSAAELGLTDDHGGLCDLDATLVPGTPADDVLPLRDVVFEVDNKSLTHRPDLWGYVGMARELAAWLGRPLRMPEAPVRPGPAAPPAVTVADPDGCPRYAALGLTVPAVAPSPLWLQALLARSGVRPINNVVDATNFVMLELGNPLHAFDARQVAGNRIDVRRAAAGERVRTLDGVERTLDPEALLICDGERPVALAGIMGLQNSEIVADTTALVLEAANFRADVVRRGAVKAKLRTEASTRFEKSLDPDLPPVAAWRFAALLAEIAPGTVVTTSLADVSAGRPPLPEITIAASYVNDRLGTALSGATIAGMLRGLGFTVSGEDELHVVVPGWRATKDVAIKEDLVEEIGRLYGYDNIPPARPLAPLPTPYRHPGRLFHRRVRTALSHVAAMTELQLYSFASEAVLDSVGRSGAPRVEVANPISSDARFLRTELAPGVLAAVARNRLQADSASFYEIGRVYQPNDGAVPVQPYRLALATWQRRGTGDFAADQEAALLHLKGLLAVLAARLGLSLRYRATAAPPPWLHPVRAAEVLAGDVPVGTVGAVHPRAAEALELGGWLALGELDLDALQALPAAFPYAPPPRFPALPMDLSVVLPVAVTAAEVEATLRAAAPATLTQVELVADFRGAPIPAGQKSLTWRLLLQSPERTLAMTEGQEVVARCTAAVAERHGGWVRA